MALAFRHESSHLFQLFLLRFPTLPQQAPYAFLVAIVALALTLLASLLSIRFPATLLLPVLGCAPQIPWPLHPEP